MIVVEDGKEYAYDLDTCEKINQFLTNTDMDDIRRYAHNLLIAGYAYEEIDPILMEEKWERKVWDFLYHIGGARHD